MSDEMNKLSLRVEYNESFKEEMDKLIGDINNGTHNIPEEHRDLYNRCQANGKGDEFLQAYALKNAAENHIETQGKFIEKTDREGNLHIGVSYKLPVKDTDENGAEQDLGNINFAVFGNGSIVFDDNFKDLFADYDQARTPVEKQGAAKVIKAKMTEVSRTLTAGGVEKISLRNVDGLADDKRQMLSDTLETVNADNHPDHVPGNERTGNDEDNMNDFAQRLEAEYNAEIQSLQEKVAKGEASEDELKAAASKFKGSLSSLGVRKGLFRGNCKKYTSIWGEKVWRIYPDANSMIDDGKIDKDGHVKHTYSVEVKMKKTKKGLKVSYGLPYGKLLDSQTMKALLDAQKAAGNQIVALPMGRPGKEYGDWWSALASKQMVPDGTKGPFPDPKDIRDMMKTVTEKGVGTGKVSTWMELMIQEAGNKYAVEKNDNMQEVISEMRSKLGTVKENERLNGRDFNKNMDAVAQNFQDAKLAGKYTHNGHEVEFDAADGIAICDAMTKFMSVYLEGGTLKDLKGFVPDQLAAQDIPLASIVKNAEHMEAVIYSIKGKLKPGVEDKIAANMARAKDGTVSIDRACSDIARASQKEYNTMITKFNSATGHQLKPNFSDVQGKVTPALEKKIDAKEKAIRMSRAVNQRTQYYQRTQHYQPR